MAKSWAEKYLSPAEPEIKVIDHAYAGFPVGSRMLIPTPKIIEAYLRRIPQGQAIDTNTLRSDLAAQHHADFTCPLTTGIFLRIVAEHTYEQHQGGISIEAMAPFWRVVGPGHPMVKKLTFGSAFLEERWKQESLYD